MILPDVNTLLHAVNRSSNQHAPALRALQQGFDHPRGVGFAWTVLSHDLKVCNGRYQALTE
jgi:predicted nucleic acid-binding protein